MSVDTSTLDDAALDELLSNTVTDDSSPDGYTDLRDESSESGSGEEPVVSPSDDSEDGQTEEDEVVNGDDQADSSDEDLDGSLSPEEDGEGDESNGATEDDESDDSTPDDESESTDESDEEPVAFQPLRAGGKEYPIESIDELYTLASKGIDADKKWNESSEGRKFASTLKKHNLGMDEINMLIDMKDGNKGAVAQLLSKFDIDPLEIDVDALDGKYEKTDHSTGDFELKIDDIQSRIGHNPRYQESVDIIMSTWDDKSRQMFFENPDILEKLNMDMQTDAELGFAIYDRVSPVAEKMKVLETGAKKTDLEYYVLAGKKVMDAYQKGEDSAMSKEQSDADKKKARAKTIRKKKKAVAPTTGTPAQAKSVKDVTDMTDEELDALLGVNT